MVFKGIYHITSVLISAFDRMLAYFDVTPMKITMLLVVSPTGGSSFHYQFYYQTINLPQRLL
jgi:hypothetical protein